MRGILRSTARYVVTTIDMVFVHVPHRSLCQTGLLNTCSSVFPHSLSGSSLISLMTVSGDHVLTPSHSHSSSTVPSLFLPQRSFDAEAETAYLTEKINDDARFLAGAGGGSKASANLVKISFEK